MIHPQYWSINSLFRKFWPPTDADFPYYISYLRPKGKVVLDVGAGDPSPNGSVKAFLDAGAKWVYAIEKDAERKRKAGLDKMEHVTVIREEFEPWRHLALPADAIKIDIEGWEMLLLHDLDSVNHRPIIVETHTAWITAQFLKAGFEMVRPTRDSMLEVSLVGMNGFRGDSKVMSEGRDGTMTEGAF